MNGYIHSLQSLGTVDGPGVRAVVFAAGCPLRCVYCHNPDTWNISKSAEPTEASELAARIARLYPYIKDGGVTFSGGEPCLQAEFFSELAALLKAHGLHIALDTCGEIINEEALRLISLCDLILLDVKFTTEEDYLKYTGGSLTRVTELLGILRDMGKAVWVRHVVVPGINDTEDDVRRLCELTAPYPNIERVELLPFRKLCLEKYESLGIDFPLKDTPQMSESRIRELYGVMKR